MPTGGGGTPEPRGRRKPKRSCPAGARRQRCRHMTITDSGRAADASRPLALVTGVGRTVGLGAGSASRLAASGWDIAFTFWTPYDEGQPWGAERGATEAIGADLAERGAATVAIEADLAEPD